MNSTDDGKSSGNLDSIGVHTETSTQGFHRTRAGPPHKSSKLSAEPPTKPAITDQKLPSQRVSVFGLGLRVPKGLYCIGVYRRPSS